MFRKPMWLHVKRWADVENMRVLAFHEVRNTQL